MKYFKKKFVFSPGPSSYVTIVYCSAYDHLMEGHEKWLATMRPLGDTLLSLRHEQPGTAFALPPELASLVMEWAYDCPLKVLEPGCAHQHRSAFS